MPFSQLLNLHDLDLISGHTTLTDCHLHPSKKLGSKNMLNSRQFYTTSDFDCEYLRNDQTYPKSERHVIVSNSFCIWQMKSGELWSTNYKVGNVSLYPLKCTFSVDYTLALRGCCYLKFLHALKNHQCLLAHTANGDRAPPKM